MGTSYEWKNGYTKAGISAAAFQSILNEIEESKGLVSPADVVEVAKPKSHQLHNSFEWDNKVAGEAWRITQAQGMIRSVCVIVHVDESDKAEEHTLAVRAMSSVVTEDGRGYVSTARVMNEADMLDQVMNQAQQDARAFVRKYEAYKELSSIVTSMQEFINTTELVPA